MKDSLVDKLLKSFDKLEDCIALTESVLKSKEDVPQDVLARVQGYHGVVDKQRLLAEQLRTHLEQENWNEVTRHIKIINGLSALIRDDAHEILAGANQYPSSAETSPNFC